MWEIRSNEARRVLLQASRLQKAKTKDNNNDGFEAGK